MRDVYYLNILVLNVQRRSDDSLLLMVDFGKEPKNALVIHKGTQVSLLCLMQFVVFCVCSCV